MNNIDISDGREVPAELTALEQHLNTSEAEPGLLRSYYDAAMAARQFNHARHFLGNLQKNAPGNHSIRRIYIAVCLQIEDYVAAMDAIETLVAFSKADDALINSALNVRDKIGPLKISPAAGKHLSLSLCMVVRNEASRIGPCLNAIKAIADEIVVVDTGSLDRTADIARIYGAQVYDHKWRQDFSAARNFALGKAHGDSILILDADEIIAARDLPPLKALISSNDKMPRAFCMETRNYANVANSLNWQPNEGQYPQYEAGLGWFPSRKIRLFPRSKKIRFCFPVHELVDPSVQAAGISIVNCSVPVHHYGHLNESKNKSKAQVYFEIGFAKLELLGNNIAALRELAVQAGQLEYWDQSLMLWQRLLNVQPNFPEAYVNMAGASWQLGHYEEAINYARECLKLIPELKEARYNLAISHLLLGRAKEAANLLDKLVLQYPGYLAASFMSGAAHCAMGDITRSRPIFQCLNETAAGPALGMAVDDLVRRFHKSGLDQYAVSLRQDAHWLKLHGNCNQGEGILRGM
jgi:glycosyltransferase involved in cell wall biosynthesis